MIERRGTKPFAVRHLPVEVWERLKIQSAYQQRPMTEIVIEAIREKLDKLEGE